MTRTDGKLPRKVAPGVFGDDVAFDKPMMHKMIPRTLSSEKVQKPTRTPVEPLSLPEADDTFMMLIRRAAEEHVKQLSDMQTEHERLKLRLNTVLQATWGFREDGLHGKLPNSTEGSLVLLAQEDHQMAWTVPEEIDQPTKSPEAVEEFELRQLWKASRKRNSGISNSKEALVDNARKARELLLPTDEEARGCLAKCMYHPTSNRRILWDMVSVFLLLYDIVTVPIEAFAPPADQFTIGMDWTTLIFWTFDVFASFATGYSDNGLIRMHPSAIASHYLKTWFVVDCVILIPDWAFTLTGAFTSSGPKGSNVTKLLRAFRIVRVLRLLRLAKLRRLLMMIKDNIQSEVVFKMTTIGQYIIIMLFSNHFLGSLWYCIGAYSGSTETWIKAGKYELAQLDYRYISSLYWSLSHFALSTEHIEPKNTWEKLFAIFLTISGMLFFWTMSAFITSAMIETQANQMEASKQLWLLRRYLRQHETPSYLTFRVLRFADNFMKHQRESIPESKLTILPYLSEHLRLELKYSISFVCINIHPLFEAAYRISRNTMHSLVHVALNRSTIAKGDLLFKRGIWATHMYWLVKGELFYEKTGFERKLQADDWLCEAVLWVSWATRGKVQADEDSELIAIDAKAFATVIRGDEILCTLMATYARNFADWLNNSMIEDLMDIFLGDRSRPFLAAFVGEQSADMQQQSQRATGSDKQVKDHVTSFD
eukprot:TRINITY_DN28067_c0_g1_i1.p1 TRINITY_DN28067_c0_g1~~TRINITY_DN28067_c0_g1_i1.p1  ORF type:complete len:709 (-),score=132.99 TRINITY_DN28067_c0_g1_i1:45-2171(-)